MWVATICLFIAIAAGKKLFNIPSNLTSLKNWVTSLLHELSSQWTPSYPSPDTLDPQPSHPAPPRFQSILIHNTSHLTPKSVLKAIGRKDGTVSIYPSINGKHNMGILTTSAKDAPITEPMTKRRMCFVVKPDTEKAEEQPVTLLTEPWFRGLTILNVPKDPNNIAVDVVAVTGFNGHPYNSFMHPETGKMWLRDFLPSDIDGSIRVMTYGYEAVLHGSLLADPLLLDYSLDFIQMLQIARKGDTDGDQLIYRETRPLVFIGHDLGGIIILKTLIQCLTRPRYACIREASRNFFFFGVPYHGLNIANIEDLISSLPQADNCAKRVLRQLTEDALYEQVINMIPFWKGRRLFNFYAEEGNATRITATVNNFQNIPITVPPTATHLMVPEETRIPVSSAHSEMLKFSSRTDEAYITLLRHIQEVVNESVGGKRQ